MRKMTLSWRLAFAFGALILIMCMLGGLAVVRMSLAAGRAAAVSKVRVPELEVASQVNTSAWETRYYLSKYALIGEPAMLKSGRQKLATTFTALTDAAALANMHPELVDFRQAQIEASKKTTEYEAATDAIEAEYKILADSRIALDAAGSTFADEVSKLQILQQEQAIADSDARVAPAAMKGRIVKLGMIATIRETGDGIRIKNFKAQVDRNMDALSAVIKDFDILDKSIADLRPLLRQQLHINQLTTIQKSADNYRSAMSQFLKSQLTIDANMASMSAAGDALISVSAVAKDALPAVMNEATGVTDGLSLTSLILIIGLVLALIAGVLVAWLSTRAITRPIREGVNTLAAASGQISTTISELASNASEAAAAVAETTTTVDEVRQTAQVSAEKAKTVAESAQGAASAAEAGRLATGQTVEGMNLMRDQMSSVIESITRLSEQSAAVGDIVSTVTDLAEQSNLLAVNASIEAAKAGDMGKGFAVVAQEIRTLAEQSKDSTRQVRLILTDVQKATAKAVLAAEQGGKGVADGGRQAGEAGQAISTLASSVQEASRAAVQIAASSQQQLTGMEQVSRAMENIRLATSQNAEGARQLGQAAHNLLEVGARLKALVDSGSGAAPATKGE